MNLILWTRWLVQLNGLLGRCAYSFFFGKSQILRSIFLRHYNVCFKSNDSLNTSVAAWTRCITRHELSARKAHPSSGIVLGRFPYHNSYFTIVTSLLLGLSLLLETNKARQRTRFIKPPLFCGPFFRGDLFLCFVFFLLCATKFALFNKQTTSAFTKEYLLLSLSLANGNHFFFSH